MVVSEVSLAIPSDGPCAEVAGASIGLQCNSLETHPLSPRGASMRRPPAPGKIGGSRHAGTDPSIHAQYPGPAQGFRSSLQGCAGGHDVVDQRHVFRQCVARLQGEGATQVALAGVCIQFRLGRGGTLASQCLGVQRNVQRLGQRLGQFQRLVIAALA